MSAPFGIAFHSPVSELSVVRELAQGGYVVEPPTPHPLFISYLVRATPTFGVVWVKGLGTVISSDNFGTATSGAVDRVAEQLTHRYGRPTKTDFLMPGSVWSDPQDWMTALNNNERYYSYIWERPTAELPEDLESIYVGATGDDGYAAQVVLEYASRKLPQAEAELERQMASLL